MLLCWVWNADSRKRVSFLENFVYQQWVWKKWLWRQKTLAWEPSEKTSNITLFEISKRLASLFSFCKSCWSVLHQLEQVGEVCMLAMLPERGVSHKKHLDCGDRGLPVTLEFRSLPESCSLLGLALLKDLLWEGPLPAGSSSWGKWMECCPLVMILKQESETAEWDRLRALAPWM